MIPQWGTGRKPSVDRGISTTSHCKILRWSQALLGNHWWWHSQTHPSISRICLSAPVTVACKLRMCLLARLLNCNYANSHYSVFYIVILEQPCPCLKSLCALNSPDNSKLMEWMGRGVMHHNTPTEGGRGRVDYAWKLKHHLLLYSFIPQKWACNSFQVAYYSCIIPSFALHWCRIGHRIVKSKLFSIDMHT